MDTQLSPRLYADLVGKPFVDGARGPDAYDCVGLAAEIQRRRGLAVPEFVSSEGELHRQIEAGGFLAGCQRLREAEPGCVALIKMSVQEHHLGTMVSRFRMIHTTAQTRGTVVESILGPLWQRRILGFYQLGAISQICNKPASQLAETLAPGIGFYPNPDEAAR